jgi:hypothetical protein
MTRENPTGTAVDLSGLVTRASFRAGSVGGSVLFTLTDGDGITISAPTTGVIEMKINRTRSALMTAGVTVYFDVEQTNPSDSEYEWQSRTYFFKPDEQVTR